MVGKNYTTPGADLHKRLTPGTASWLGIKIRGLSLNYVVTQNDCSAELYIDKDKDTGEINKAIYDQLLAQKEGIEAAFGGPLKWERLDNRRASRIRFTEPGGYRNPPEEWPSIHRNITDAMKRLHAAIEPHISNLNNSTEQLMTTE